MPSRAVRAYQLWYTPEQYPEVRAMMDDGHLLPAAYAHWLEGAEQREEQVRSAGAVPFRVPLDPSEFRRFCLHFSAPLNSEFRTKFAILKGREKHSDSH